MNYRSKGGRFYKPEDLQKIWGLPAGFYERVASHIQITTALATPTPYRPNISPAMKTQANHSGG